MLAYPQPAVTGAGVSEAGTRVGGGRVRAAADRGLTVLAA